MPLIRIPAILLLAAIGATGWWVALWYARRLEEADEWKRMRERERARAALARRGPVGWEPSRQHHPRADREGSE